MSQDRLPNARESRAVVQLRNGAAHRHNDQVATEVPLALEYNGLSHAVLLVSPCDLEDLVLGFSCTEGILDNPTQLYDLDIETTAQGLVAHVHIASEQLYRLKQRRRQLAGRTGCGLCGLENLGDVIRALPGVPVPTTPLTPMAVVLAAQQMLTRQPLRSETGATHAAAWASPQGALTLTREDLGRHNALDKLMGSLLHEHGKVPPGFCVISSRASFEMVQKAASLGVTALVALSAATTLAIDTAHDLGVMLAGFARDNQFTVYSHPELLTVHGDLHEQA